MKVKYLGTLFAASVLSLGLVTSCATPEAGETDVDTGADVIEPDTETEVIDPVDPVDSVDPELEEVDPCAGELNPCAGE